MSTIDSRNVHISEKEIEDYLYENPSALGIDRWIDRQLHLPSGIADLVGIKDESIVVIELKKGKITSDALTQVCRYAADIETIFRLTEMEYEIGSAEKVVISPHSISDKIMYEANALGVGIHVFEINLSVKISGRYDWTRNHTAQYYEKIEGIAQTSMFTSAAENIDWAIHEGRIEKENEEHKDKQ